MFPLSSYTTYLEPSERSTLWILTILPQYYLFCLRYYLLTKWEAYRVLLISDVALWTHHISGGSLSSIDKALRNKMWQHWKSLKCRCGHRKLAHDLDITIIAVHHTKKKTDFETEPLDQILGSQAISATVETILVLQRTPRSQNIDLFITGKDVEEVDDYTLFWNGHGFNEPVERRLASLGSMQRSIFDYVEQNPRCTQAAIVEHLGRTKQQINEAVGRMLELGLLKNASGGRLFVNNTA